MSHALHLDYETRSAVDLKGCGAHRYAIDPSTEILMCAASWDDSGSSDEVLLWINPRFRTPDELGDNEEVERMVAEAKLLKAHNAPFEQAITWGILQQRKACPFTVEPPLERWRCSAALLRKAGLPASLEQGGEALGLGASVKKDHAGKALIRFFCVPQADGTFRQPKDHPEKWQAFCNYCRQDVRAEKAIDRKLKAFELQGISLATFQFDLRMNQRGVPINVTAARHAQAIIDTVQARVSQEFRRRTGLNPSQREKVRELVGLPDMQADTVEEAIQQLSRNIEQAKADGMWDAIPGVERKQELLEMYQKLSYAAVKKVQTMLDCVCPDGRVRGAHLWYGTGPGRSSGKLLQPQNFKKTPPELRPVTKEVYAAIAKGVSADGLEAIYGEPIELIAACIRHFIHAPGRVMLDGDYAAIQARIICWLAGQTDALDEYRRGMDRYKLMASIIYQTEVARVTPDQREVGKRAILGLGFQMGTDKFRSSCREQYGLDLPKDLCERAKVAFRQKHDKIVNYWYKLDRDARAAVGRPGETHGAFTVRRLGGIPFLLAKLPSGRSIAYPHPKIETERVEDAERTQVTYWGQQPMSTQWGRIKLYGGKLAENLTMGVEADIMGCGCIEAERLGMEPFMLVHDQALALASSEHTPEQFARALTTLPDWTAGLPVVAETKITPYYTK